MSFFDEQDYLESDIGDQLTPDERCGLLMLPVSVFFADLKEIGQVEDYVPRWSLSYRLPKNAPVPAEQERDGVTFGQVIFAVAQLIGEKTWKKDAGDKMEVVWDCIDKGVSPKKSCISVQDGDLHRPEYNAGCWVIKSSRREDEGRPAIYDKDGSPIYDKKTDELIGDLKGVAQPGDLCMVVIRVWAQKAQDRINFTLEGVRLVKRGGGMKEAALKQRDQAVSKLEGNVLLTLPAGFDGPDEEEEEPKPERSSKKKKSAAKKKVGKKTPAKKKGSVFRSRKR